MADQAVIAKVPISYVSTIGVTAGRQVFVDVTLLKVSAGSLVVPPAYNEAQSWIAELFKLGLIEAVATSPASPAIVFQAAEWGALGNNTQVAITANTDPTKFDVKVSRTDTYTRVTLATLLQKIGSAMQPGQSPGLVRVKNTSTKLPLAGTQQLQGGGPTVRSSVKLDATAAGDGQSVELEAKGTTAEGDNTFVTISNVDATSGTFTLAAKWEKSVPGVTVATAAAQLQGVAYLVAVAKPDGATDFGFPMPSALELTGGVDAVQARATALAAGT